MVKLKSLQSVYFVACLINYLSAVSIDSSYNTLKFVTKPFDVKQKKAPFQAIKISTNNIEYTVTLNTSFYV